MENRRVVLVPSPFQGHINPMLELGTVLYSKGFSVTIIHAKFNSPNPSTHPEFTFLPISDNLTDSDKTTKDLIALIDTINTKCEAPILECVAKIIDQQGSLDRLVCIINDVIMFAGERVAKHFNIPSIMLHTCNASTMFANSLIPRLEEKGNLSHQDLMSLDLVPGLEPLRYKDLPLFDEGITVTLRKLIAVVTNTGTASAIIWNTIEELEKPALDMLQKRYKIPFYSIGPLFKFSPFSSSGSIREEDNNCIEWLDKQAPRSVLYVSLGSIVSVNEKELTEMAWGLARSNQPFLWVVRTDFVLNSTEVKFPAGFENEIQGRGFVVKWAPQKKVLAHKAIGGFWSHCGWNSILESIGEGIPMICSPGFGDQKVNSRYVSNVWKVGIELDGGELERGQIERGVRRLMTDKEGEEVRERANQLKAKVDASVNKGGNSYNCLNDFAKYISSL